jgi:hypothetical protein
MVFRRLILVAVLAAGYLSGAVGILRADEHIADAPQSVHEPATPDEVFDSPPKLPDSSHLSGTVKIDGAGDGAKDEAATEVREDDPYPNGFSVRWLMPLDGFGITDLELGSVDHRPRFTDHTRFNLVIPFAVHFVDEPQALGIPSELYSAQIETRLAHPNEIFGFDISVIPGWFSDFDAGKQRLSRHGHGIATMRVSETLQLAARHDVSGARTCAFCRRAELSGPFSLIRRSNS